MLRKTGFLLILASFLASSALLIGCGAKGAKPETMSELEEAKAACEAARGTAKDLELRRMDLEEELAAKKAEVAELTAERDLLKSKM